jgi:putative flippase GtrA
VPRRDCTFIVEVRSPSETAGEAARQIGAQRRTSGARRLGVFNAVGLAGFVIQVSVIAWLTRAGGWHHVPATIFAMQTAIVHNYLAHSRWTWADRPARTRRERCVRPLRYQAAKTISLVVNVALTAGFVAAAGLPPELANGVAVCLCAALNYLVADRLVFRAGGHTLPTGRAVPR